MGAFSQKVPGDADVTQRTGPGGTAASREPKSPGTLPPETPAGLLSPCVCPSAARPRARPGGIAVLCPDASCVSPGTRDVPAPRPGFGAYPGEPPRSGHFRARVPARRLPGAPRGSLPPSRPLTRLGGRRTQITPRPLTPPMAPRSALVTPGNSPGGCCRVPPGRRLRVSTRRARRHLPGVPSLPTRLVDFRCPSAFSEIPEMGVRPAGSCAQGSRAACHGPSEWATLCPTVTLRDRVDTGT